ncbi:MULTISPECIES: SDR family NAD(P)-dependent oxidoreductase [Methylosinus]|uniref:NAD(P)-dependent oxidoreductase n=1 Tax=Methylosinus trichosporium (strain ATCC 35070 / NCIMB 11131 / UNIQEM 75 / OB3b) TaxID=595536 RepID=A0A2D2D077_METT3|nr:MULTISPECIES: SDR family oxidoreductase [Methylosinus]ATQ68344.1 NAD(P)-dependent oxidoreductase [Methylosinus trichosporium OB3b]OBS50918.1 short-chain dehydrogenase [Methylosinus sp. 3S-1]
MSENKTAIVTGASDGIGLELARIFARKGHHVTLVARRGDRLETLAAEIVAAGGEAPLVVPLDLCAEGAAERLEAALAEAGRSVEFLVNNAGFGLIGRAAELDAAEQLASVDLNIRALTALTLRFLPSIVAARGGILNVASVASFMPGPGFAVYYASKAYVRSFSEALAEELKGVVRVTALCPGPVRTGFQARAGFDFNGEMMAMRPALLPASEVALQGYEALAAGRRVVVPGLVNKFFVLTGRLAPRAVLMPLLARAQRAR